MIELSPDTITRDTRPPLSCDRKADWYAKASRLSLLLTGPRLSYAEQARAYALDATQDAEPAEYDYEH